MNRIRQPSPALIVAALALVATLAGTAIAGTDATTSASVKKQVKALKKRVTALEQTDPVPGPQGPPGEQGLPGTPGQDATNLFAYIRDNGSADTATVGYGSGVAVIDPAGNSTYQLFFNQSLVNCVVHATAGLGKPAGTSAISGSFPTFDLSAGGPNQVAVTFINTAASVTDTSFFITAFC